MKKILTIIIILILAIPHSAYSLRPISTKPSQPVESHVVTALTGSYNSLNIARRTEEKLVVETEYDFVDYVGATELKTLFESANGTEFGVNFLTDIIHRPHKDSRDVKYAYSLQETLALDPDALTELNKALSELDFLTDEALKGLPDWGHSQEVYDRQTKTNKRILMPETGELPKVLESLRALIERFDNPETNYVLSHVKKIIEAYAESFPADGDIFQNWKFNTNFLG